MISLREGLALSPGGVVCFVGAGGKTSLMFRLARELSAGGDSVLTTTTTKIKMPDPTETQAVVIAPEAEAIISRVRQVRTAGFHFTAVAEKLDCLHKLKGYAPEFIDDLWKRRLFRWILVEADGAAGRSLKAPAGHEPVIPACTGWVVGLAGLDAVGNALEEHSVFRSDIFTQLTGLAAGRKVSPAAIAASLTHAAGIFKGSPGAAGRYIFLNKAESADRIHAGRQIAEIIKKTIPSRIKRILMGSIQKNPPVMEYYDVF